MTTFTSFVIIIQNTSSSEIFPVQNRILWILNPSISISTVISYKNLMSIESRIDLIALIANSNTLQTLPHCFSQKSSTSPPGEGGKLALFPPVYPLRSERRFVQKPFLPPPRFHRGTARRFLWKALAKKALLLLLPPPSPLCRQLFRFTTLWTRWSASPPFSVARNVSPWFFRQRGGGGGLAWLRKQVTAVGDRLPFGKSVESSVQSSRPTHLPRDWLGKVVGDSFTLQIGGWNRHQKTFSLAFPLVTFSRGHPSFFIYFFFFFLFLSCSSLVDFWQVERMESLLFQRFGDLSKERASVWFG